MKVTPVKIILGISIALIITMGISGVLRPESTSAGEETASRMVQLEPTGSQGSFFTTIMVDTKTGIQYLIVSSSNGIAVTRLGQ